MSYTTAQLAGFCGGRLIGSGGAEVLWATNDQRTIGAPGALFCCFAGAKSDGHAYVRAALEAGAVAALVEERKVPELLAEGPLAMDLVAVPNVPSALWLIAECCRESWRGPTVATTGSAGKTTTKNMLRGILEGALGGGLSTRGNNNNLLGVPLTLVGLGERHHFLNLELGSNAPGEIGRLALLALPDVAVITAVLEAHLEGFGSLSGVLLEKSSLGRVVGEGGYVVVPSYVAALAERPFRGRCVKFGHEAGDYVRLSGARETAAGCAAEIEVDGRAYDLELPVPGVFNLRNAAAALAAATMLGVPAEAAIESLHRFEPEAMRMQVVEAGGVTFLVDAYNANPGSMEAALQSLAQRQAVGRKIAVLGGMWELGVESVALHERVGAYAATLGLGLVAVGPGSSDYLRAHGGEPSVFQEDAVGAAAWLRQNLSRGDLVLLKGSRSARMERVLSALQGEVA